MDSCAAYFQLVSSHTDHTMKDTRLLRVRHRGGAASCHVAVEGHLEGVAIGSVIKETTEETSTSTSFHHVTIKRSVGLEKYIKKVIKGSNQQVLLCDKTKTNTVHTRILKENIIILMPSVKFGLKLYIDKHNSVHFHTFEQHWCFGSLSLLLFALFKKKT